MIDVRFSKLVINALLSFLLFVSLFVVFASPTPVFAAGLSISSKTPTSNALDIIKTSNIVVEFSTSINGTTINANTFNVYGSISGKTSGSYSGGGSSNITFNPTSDFEAGETVTVTLTTGIKGTDNTTLANPLTWQFVIEVPQGYARFIDSGQSLDSSWSQGVALRDVDNDGDLDAFVANAGQPKKVWLNDGSGNFSIWQSLGGSYIYSYDGALGDLDGDGDLDAFVANYAGEGVGDANKVWLNNGNGSFTGSELCLVSHVWVLYHEHLRFDILL
ncbi:Ig-like domain-containing protein [Chloroflexota bacterium]